jgi:hypothetical protein
MKLKEGIYFIIATGNDEAWHMLLMEGGVLFIVQSFYEDSTKMQKFLRRPNLKDKFWNWTYLGEL